MKPYLKIAIPLGLIATTFITWVILAYAACTSGGTATTVLSLCKPASGETGWAAVINANYDTIDALFQAGSLLKVTAGGTGLSTAGSDASKALMSNGSGGFAMGSPSGAVLVLSGRTGATTQSAFCSPTGVMNEAGPSELVCSATEADVSLPMPSACTARNLYVRTGTGNVAATTITVRKNAAATALTVASSAAANTTTSDTVNTVSFAAGDLMAINFSATGTTAWGRIVVQC